MANGQIALKLMSRGLFQNTDDAVWRALTVTLQRQGGALGFNIMGGFTVSHGRVAEKVTWGGWLRTKDRDINNLYMSLIMKTSQN